jgi:DNA-binding PadR family transcriptional regulator
MTKLVILWLLSEGPLHGYRIKRILDDGSLRFWFPIEVGSIYSVLRSLERAGYVETEVVEREGLRPERTRYRITKSGRQHFEALLRDAWRKPALPSDTIDLALAARSELGEEEADALLQERADVLRARLQELDRIAPSAPAAEMVDRARALTEAELKWVEDVIKKDRKERR